MLFKYIIAKERLCFSRLLFMRYPNLRENKIFQLIVNLPIGAQVISNESWYVHSRNFSTSCAFQLSIVAIDFISTSIPSTRGIRHTLTCPTW